MLTRLMTAALILWVVQGSFTSPEGSDTSHNLEVIRKAKSDEMRKYMNDSADPCENFFDFACGNWKTLYPADADETKTDWYTLALKDFGRKLTRLLITFDDMDTESERKVKNFYASCLNLASLKQAGYNEKLRAIVKEFGQMPAMEGDKWLQEDFDWLQTVAEISYKYGLTIVLGYEIFPDQNDHTANSMYLSKQEFVIQSDFDLHRDSYILRTEKSLRTHLDLEDQIVHALAKEIVDFEALLWEANQLDSKTASKTITIDDMYKKYSPDFDVKKLFNISYGTIPTDLKMNICPYVESLIDIMKKTPKKVVANYIFYNLLLKFMVKIPESKTALEELCAAKTQEYFPKVVSYMFYQANDLTDNEHDFGNMLQDIKSTLQMILESNKLYWFDDKSREYTLEKLHSLKTLLPSYEENNFDVEYSHLIISEKDYLDNQQSLMALKAANTRASLNDMPQYLDIGLYMDSPVYMTISNTAIIPVSVLQSDFFWSKMYPNALNYGHIGFLISHELLHGFSGSGRFFNKLGNFAGGWSLDLEVEYYVRRKCLYNQYHNYTFGGLHLPQAKFQGENAADNAGVVLAYEAYRRWYEDSGRTEEQLDLETLTNLSYNNNQLFFINYAQFWCADTYEAERAIRAASDVHSPDEFRAFVPLTNFEEFSKAFKCPKGTAMNPVKKCEIY